MDKIKQADFAINSRPLTRSEEIAISEYIRAYKTKHFCNEIISKRFEKKLVIKQNNSVINEVIA